MKVAILILFALSFSPSESSEVEEQVKFPTVVIGILVRNRAHTLPYFLSYLEKLNYPKDKISLWIRSDNNHDTSIVIVNDWLNRVGFQYNKVNYKNDVDDLEYKEKTTKVWAVLPLRWTDNRNRHVMEQKEEALNYARMMNSEFLFILDPDVVLVDSNVLLDLTQLNLTIVGPLVFRYKPQEANIECDPKVCPSKPYFDDILQYKERGIFKVSLVHSAVLINLSHEKSTSLTFKMDNPVAKDNDQSWIHNHEVFLKSADSSKLSMYISNLKFYGLMLTTLNAMEKLEDGRELIVHPDLKQFVNYPKKDTMTFSKIFMINLKRRSERRRRMEEVFIEMGLEVDFYDAVDGKKGDIRMQNVTLYPGYRNRYTLRRMRVGEIGCFLSHYNIWTEIVKQNLKEVFIVEDDAMFIENFKEGVKVILNEAQASNISWDFIYFGRYRDDMTPEVKVPGSINLVYPEFSLWTIAYVLTLEGAKKLIAGNPLQRMLPVDEYISIMYDKHPNDTLRNSFEPRNLVALSTHYIIVHSNVVNVYNSKSIASSDTEFSEDTLSDDQFTKRGNESLVLDLELGTPNVDVEQSLHSSHTEL